MHQRQFTVIYRLVALFLLILIIYMTMKLAPVGKWFTHLLSHIIAPFFFAAFISYLLTPIVNKLTKFKLNRGLAVFLLFLFVLLSTGLLIYISYPTFVRQLVELNEQLPHFIDTYDAIIYSFYESTSTFPPLIQEKIIGLKLDIESYIGQSLEKLIEYVVNLFDHIFIIAITPVLVYYLLLDYSKIKATVKKFVAPEKYKKLERLLTVIDEGLGNYIRGQLFVSSIVMIITYLLFYTIKLPYAFVLAIVMGLMNVVPYFGPIIGTIPAICIALTISWKYIVFVIGTTIVVQALEGGFLSPYIMGKSVHIHPIAIIAALLIGAELGGFFGMLLAVPLFTIARSIYVQYYVKKVA